MRTILQIFSKRVFDSYRKLLSGPNYNTPLGRWVGGEFYVMTSTFDHCGDEKCGNVLDLKRELKKELKKELKREIGESPESSSVGSSTRGSSTRGSSTTRGRVTK